jgi:hypothetical protein
VVKDPSQENNLAEKPEYAARVNKMRDLLVQCRIPIAKVPEACGAEGAYAVWNGGDAYVTANHPAGPTPHGVDNLAMPAWPLTGVHPQPEVRLYFEGADTWPWVPNFRTMIPEVVFPMEPAEKIRAQVPENRACGLAMRGYIDLPTEQEVTFKAMGAGGCQLWLHEAHIFEYEAGDCAQGRATTYKLAAGRHPFRLYLTTKDGVNGLCTVSAGAQVLV